MKVFLRLEVNQVIGEIPLENHSSIVIGRNKQADHHIPDELMSSLHCRIFLKNNILEIEDLNSKNGTYINGIRIEKSEVFIGDEIKIGSTKLSIISEKMDHQSIQVLTFPGGQRNRSLHGLKLDFTGARTINQNHLNTKQASAQSMNKEVETRIKAHSMIKLSKEQVKVRHRKLASLATTIDMLLFVCALAAPLIAINSLALMNYKIIIENRFSLLCALEITIVGLTYLINYKIMKFSLGEQLSGIETKYLNQKN